MRIVLLAIYLLQVAYIGARTSGDSAPTAHAKKALTR